MADKDIEALSKIDEILASVEDKYSKTRILKWIFDKYAQDTNLQHQTNAFQDIKMGKVPIIQTNEIPGVALNEIPGVALIDEQGEIKFTIRDIKAKSANDAGIRYALIACLVHEKLTREKSMSSKKNLVPLLKDRRVYTSNVRKQLAGHHGIIREGDNVRLDTHARSEAETILSQILDPEYKGKWSPDKVGKKAKGREKSKKLEKKPN